MDRSIIVHGLLPATDVPSTIEAYRPDLNSVFDLVEGLDTDAFGKILWLVERSGCIYQSIILVFFPPEQAIAHDLVDCLRRATPTQDLECVLVGVTSKDNLAQTMQIDEMISEDLREIGAAIRSRQLGN